MAKSKTLHITSGDCAGDLLRQANLPGEIFVWHDVLYDGPRNPSWPIDVTIEQRAEFLYVHTGGGLAKEKIVSSLQEGYRKLQHAAEYSSIVLWFDSCVFDQSMLAHILTCLCEVDRPPVELICVDEYPGIDPYHGLGQLGVEQLAGFFPTRQPVSPEQFEYAKIVDRAFALKDVKQLQILSEDSAAPLPWVPACAARWLQELPDSPDGLGFLDRCILEVVNAGSHIPGEIFKAVAALDTPPQYWGDTTLWEKINKLADRQPPLLNISGPAPRLPQWFPQNLSEFNIHSAG